METLVSIIISFFVAWYFAKKQMKKNEITHFSISSYNIGKDLHNEFPEFQLIYKNEIISNNIQILKGGFINTGENDIVGLKNKSDITISLPESCIFREIKITKKSDGLEVVANILKGTPNIIDFAINEKIISGESFEYVAIVETKEDINKLHSFANFKHRIPNTSKIKNEYIGQQIRKNVPFFLYITIFAAIAFTLASITTLSMQKINYSLIEKSSNNEMFIYMTPNSQLYVSDNDILPHLNNHKISKEDLDSKYTISLDTEYKWCTDSTYMGIFSALLAILYIISAIWLSYRWNKKKRIWCLIERFEKK